MQRSGAPAWHRRRQQCRSWYTKREWMLLLLCCALGSAWKLMECLRVARVLASATVIALRSCCPLQWLQHQHSKHT
jgi:hypothetical protein